MTNDCYTAVPETDDWIDLDDGFNSTYHFGWDDDGLRGHVFTNEDNSTIILAYKGTSLVGGTQFKDKRNDNLLFSCCCGRVSYLWRPVCDCYEDTYTCNAACLENELRSRKHYYRAALDVYHDVKRDFPKGDIWIVGHSLGGAVASLVAQTYGLPAVTFQAPGEKLSARRLGLPIMPDAGFAKHIWAFGHTADPLFMGTCGGITSACWTAGFAMETHCHSGYECVYDTVEDLGWRQGVSTHRIRNVIEDVIMRYNSTPTPVRTDECVDCFNWNVSG
ncbi:triacylglycerol lipase [Protomyces lactucae-debilis]|uniref:triacylglycerol lipase n=1 Tax=Protomyces lactucae-debilis TaxID=2754530 RepID=A0A1Y2FKD2_PROLT|nr:triacylglycerol lipase [Protomyces lactucae-debilis]ORY84410.1 triacylglycerol lipase [Protomyces lactucae-debilis]